MPDNFTWFDLFTLIALIAGPVSAVIIARRMEDRRV